MEVVDQDLLSVEAGLAGEGCEGVVAGGQNAGRVGIAQYLLSRLAEGRDRIRRSR